jgi:hypothetical protein
VKNCIDDELERKLVGYISLLQKERMKYSLGYQRVTEGKKTHTGQRQ